MAKRKPVQHEKKLQSSVCHFLKMALPADATYLVLPGGAATKTKAPGYVRGTPDLMVIYQGRARFIELKAPGKSSDTSPDQDAILSKLRACGATTAICESIDGVELFLGGVCRIPLNARARA